MTDFTSPKRLHQMVTDAISDEVGALPRCCQVAIHLGKDARFHAGAAFALGEVESAVMRLHEEAEGEASRLAFRWAATVVRQAADRQEALFDEERFGIGRTWPTVADHSAARAAVLPSDAAAVLDGIRAELARAAQSIAHGDRTTAEHVVLALAGHLPGYYAEDDARHALVNGTA